MAQNPAATYGVDVACFTDADALFSTVTGIALVAQDAYHVLTTDNFLGPGGDGRGYDLRRTLGMKDADLPGLQPQLVEVLTRDPRVFTADVSLTPTGSTGGVVTRRFAATCNTALGPFTLILGVGALGVQLWDSQ